MAERPILFSKPMVLALLAGRKTMTRRPIKGIFCGGPGNGTGRWSYIASSTERGAAGCFSFSEIVSDENRQMLRGEQAEFTERGREIEYVRVRPLCIPGDLLYVRETWQIATGRDAGDLGAVVRYRDMEMQSVTMPASKPMPLGLTWDHWRPSIHMPKWAARIWLRVTDVRVERVQDITEEDARAEGFPVDHRGEHYDPPSREVDPWQGYGTASFCLAWSSLYGADSWNANPWVWRIAFERCEDPASEGGNG